MQTVCVMQDEEDELSRPLSEAFSAARPQHAGPIMRPQLNQRSNHAITDRIRAATTWPELQDLLLNTPVTLVHHGTHGAARQQPQPHARHAGPAFAQQQQEEGQQMGQVLLPSQLVVLLRRLTELVRTKRYTKYEDSSFVEFVDQASASSQGGGCRVQEGHFPTPATSPHFTTRPARWLGRCTHSCLASMQLPCQPPWLRWRAWATTRAPPGSRMCLRR